MTLTTSEGGLSAGTLFGLRPDVWKYIRGEMQKLISFHKSTADGNDHSSSIRPQQIHHSNDDRHCDSSSAIDADVHNNKDDGGKQQRKTMQQQHSSAAIRTIRFETMPMRATASSCLAKTQQQPTAQKVFTATAHSLKFLCDAFPAAAKSAAARRRHKGSTASTSHNPRAESKRV